MEKDVILAVALLVLAWAYISRVNDLARQTNQLERMLLAIAKKLDVPLPYIPGPPSQRVSGFGARPNRRRSRLSRRTGKRLVRD